MHDEQDWLKRDDWLLWGSSTWKGGARFGYLQARGIVHDYNRQMDVRRTTSDLVLKIKVVMIPHGYTPPTYDLLGLQEQNHEFSSRRLQR